VSDAIRTAGDRVAYKRGLGEGELITIPITMIREAIVSYEPGKPEGRAVLVDPGLTALGFSA